MPDYDASFKIVARASGRQLAQLAGFDCRQWEPIGGEVHATERLADRAFRARRGRDRCVVYMEAYTRWDANAPWSVLAKSSLLSERERLPTLSLVYVLLPHGYRKQRGTFRLQVEGKATQQVWFPGSLLLEGAAGSLVGSGTGPDGALSALPAPHHAASRRGPCGAEHRRPGG